MLCADLQLGIFRLPDATPLCALCCAWHGVGAQRDRLCAVPCSSLCQKRRVRFFQCSYYDSWGHSEASPALLPSALSSFLPRFPWCAAGSYYDGWGHSLASGDVEAAFSSTDCECVLEGETKMGGQVSKAEVTARVLFAAGHFCLDLLRLHNAHHLLGTLFTSVCTGALLFGAPRLHLAS